MRAQHSISRRDVLGMAVGSLALSVGVRSVGAQAAKRIEQLAPELDKIIAPSEPIQELAEGFGGPLGPAGIRLTRDTLLPQVLAARA